MKSFLTLAVCTALLATSARAQVIINEVHGFGAGAAPVLPGDYLELWNQSATDYDLSGHTISIWAGDAGALTSRVVPCLSDGRHIIPANGFWIFQEGTAVGGALTGSLAGLHGMVGLGASWSSNSSVGCRITDAGGNCVDYVYLRRLATALPATPPNLVAPCVWTLGNIAASGTGLAHIFRLTNGNTSSVADWAHDATATVGTPGAENTTGGATQTATGPIVPIQPGPPAWETNSAACDFNIDGATGTTAGPMQVNVCVNALFNVNFNSTLAGLPYDLAVGVNLGVSGTTICAAGTGGITTANGQVVNIDVADPFLTFFNGLTFTTPFPGNFSLPFIVGTPIPNLSAQMVVLNPANPDGIELSHLTQLAIVSGLTLPGPATDDSAAVIDVTTISCGGFSTVPFFGVANPNVTVISNGRMLFGGSDTDFSPTLAELIGDVPSLNFWTDMNPALAGSGKITVTFSGSTLTANWNGVYYFGTAVPITFSLSVDALSGDCTVGGLGGVVPNPAGLGGGDAQLLGICAGAAGLATNGGVNTPFLVNTAGGPPGVVTDAIYDFWAGTVATAPNLINMVETIQSGTSSVTFTPVGGSYSWIAL